MTQKFIIAIDLGGTNLKLALIDARYRIKYKDILNTKNFTQKEDLIAAIINSITKAARNNKINKRDILGIGLGLPGPIDVKQGLVHFFPNIPGWKKVNLKRILKRKLKLPVFLDNDANLMALAEFRLGAAKGLKNVVCVTLGTGVGGGLIIGGNLYRGRSFSAGEIGHIPINEIGPQCNCGGFACLEAYIGNNRIIREAKILFKRDMPLEDLSVLAKRGNKSALRLWVKIAGHLGLALAGIVNLLNPDAIIIGGGVAGAGKILFDKVKQIIMRRAMSVPAKHVKVLKAALGNDAGLIGAAIIVKRGLG